MAAKKYGAWGVDLSSIDASVRPQDDFYRYVNGSWMKRTKIPKTESRWGTFVELHTDAQRNLRKILEETPRGKRGSVEQLVHDFYHSALDYKRRNEHGASPLIPLRKAIARTNNIEELMLLSAELAKLGVEPVWDLLIDQDCKNSDAYRLYIGQGGIGLPDRDYYLLDKKEYRKVREAYVQHIARMFKLAGSKAREAESIASRVYEIERRLAEISMDKVDARDAEKTYHPMALAGLRKLVPSISWNKYFEALEAPKLPKYVVQQPEFLRGVDALFAEIPIDDWKRYVEWNLLDELSSFLSDAFTRANFDFYGKTLQGVETMQPRWRRALSSTNAHLDEALGQLYVKRHFSPEAKKRMNALVDDLFAAYGERIRSLEWMSSATKRKAIAKLHSMTRKIGYPDKWKAYRGLSVKAGAYFENVCAVRRYEHARAMKKLAGPVDRAEWHMPPQMVNAYCNFGMNEIVFPAAILQPPVFNMAADDAVNYGSIGWTIGHEMTHGFDDQGAKFDSKGNMKNWWTTEDAKKFAAKTKLVADQFDAYEALPGIYVNGKLTLGENVADLGGIAIAFDAYQRRLETTGRTDLDGYTPEQRFFMGLAQGDRELLRKERLLVTVTSDPHAPSEFRINGPLSNLEPFYRAFAVTNGDLLYRDARKRAKIW